MAEGTPPEEFFSITWIDAVLSVSCQHTHVQDSCGIRGDNKDI